MSKKTKSDSCPKVSEVFGETKAETAPEFDVVDDFQLDPRTRASKYPFDTIQIGQGFFIPGVHSPSSVYAAAKRHGKTISTRVTPNGLQVKVVA